MSAIVLTKTQPSTHRLLSPILNERDLEIKEVRRWQDVAVRTAGASMVILELKTPGLLGLDVLREIRSHTPELPVLVLTPEKPTPAVPKAIALGATEYVTRPYERIELEHALDRMLTKVRENRSVLALPRSSAPPVSKVRLLELHDPKTGRVDSARVADYLGVPLSRLARALGASYKAAHKSPSAPALQQGLRPIKRSLEILDELIGAPEAIRAWLNSPHPDLGNRTAIEILLQGHADALWRILENAMEGIPR